jgi:hypothetical protein
VDTPRRCIKNIAVVAPLVLLDKLDSIRVYLVLELGGM